jgi:hypothetical protein
VEEADAVAEQDRGEMDADFADSAGRVATDSGFLVAYGPSE